MDAENQDATQGKSQEPQPVTPDESAILERLEDSDDLSLHAHHALVHNPFSWADA